MNAAHNQINLELIFNNVSSIMYSYHSSFAETF
jgi:hypothetical protein